MAEIKLESGKSKPAKAKAPAKTKPSKGKVAKAKPAKKPTAKSNRSYFKGDSHGESLFCFQVSEFDEIAKIKEREDFYSVVAIRGGIVSVVDPKEKLKEILNVM